MWLRLHLAADSKRSANWIRRNMFFTFRVINVSKCQVDYKVSAVIGSAGCK